MIQSTPVHYTLHLHLQLQINTLHKSTLFINSTKLFKATLSFLNKINTWCLKYLDNWNCIHYSFIWLKISENKFRVRND